MTARDYPQERLAKSHHVAPKSHLVASGSPQAMSVRVMRHGPHMLPWSPLEALVLARCRSRGTTKSRRGVERSVSAIAEYLGRPRENIHRFRRRGVLSIAAAERYADIVGLHPAELWADYPYGVSA